VLILRKRCELIEGTESTMADITSVDLARRAGEQLESASPDLLRAMLQAFAEALMGAEADAACGRRTGRSARSG
jgi:transposase-like protein